MKKVTRTILALSILAGLTTGCTNKVDFMPTTNTLSAVKNQVRSNTFLVKLKNNISDINTFSDIKAVRILSPELKLAEISLNDFADLNQVKNKIAQSGMVEYIEASNTLDIQAGKLQPSNVKNNFSIKDTNDNNWQLDLIHANQKADISSANVIVAVVDSGVDSEHPELKNDLLPLIDIYNETDKDIYNNNGTAIDFTGRDGNGHGTHVAGIIDSVVKSMGVSGIKILPVKVANHLGNTSMALITKGILTALDHGAKVINISLGGSPSDGTQALRDAVNLAFKKGVTIVASSGNDSLRIHDIVHSVNIPSAYQGVISVAAVNKHDKVAVYSNGGPEIAIAAPGGEDMANDNTEKIYSTWPTYQTYESFHSGINGTHAYLVGTSMATPFVAATAALIVAKNQSLTAQQIKMRILSSADDIEDKGFDTASGYGRLNVYKALTSGNDE